AGPILDGVLAVDGVLVASLVFVSVVAAAVLAAAALVWRATRRRLRALLRHTAVRRTAVLWAMARSPAPADAPLAARLAGSWSTARARHDLWRAVGVAERAVRQAEAAGGAVGELPFLSRRLHEVATDVDRLLAMGDGLAPGEPEVDGALRQATEVRHASGRIRLVALAAAGDAATTRVVALTGDADREVRSLAAGLARARAAFPPVA
ncbi:MAG: hypothetical protein ACRDYZ_16880, partial [Acidimicrobiales bacterium]